MEVISHFMINTNFMESRKFEEIIRIDSHLKKKNKKLCEIKLCKIYKAIYNN